MSITNEIQAAARDLLAGGQVEVVIGYEMGTRGRTRPVFITDPDEVERLVWNQACTHNLTTYLNARLNPGGPGKPRPAGGAPKRAALVVKACDSRAINVLLAENHFEREQLHVIGVLCEGILEGAGMAGDQGSARQLPADGSGGLQARCQRCTERTPWMYDTLIGAQPAEPTLATGADDLQRLESMSPAERAEFWLAQFDRCIRCYACRQACPMCTCPSCLYERDDSLWVGMGLRLDEKRTFHLGRAFHLAGRCIGCDECERVCPMEIPISLLNRRLAGEVQATFGYRAGMAPTPPPFVSVLSSPHGED